MNKRIVVLGGGESGVGAAVLAKLKGFDVFLSDKGKIGDSYAEMLRTWEIPFEQGQHTEELILNADEVIKSPGIPVSAPMIQKIIGKGIHIISEIEFAGRYDTARKICITGSNGKTTTTSLIYYLLQQAGLDVGLGGNIGKSYAYQVATAHHDIYVLEISSFQLDNMYDFKADIAIITNITPDHLDRYDHNMENYVKAKFRITRNMDKDDCFIFCSDDEITINHLSQIGSTVRADLTFNFNRHVSWQSRLYFFTTYGKHTIGEFENTLVMAISRFFSTRIYVHVRYDDGVTKTADNDTYFQLNELLSFGFNYKW